jgi:hypothetical protein
VVVTCSGVGEIFAAWYALWHPRVIGAVYFARGDADLAEDATALHSSKRLRNRRGHGAMILRDWHSSSALRPPGGR